MQKNAVRYIKKCPKCQMFTNKIHQPAQELYPISSPWHFAQWGLNLIGSLPTASGNRKYLFIATDYFTKWVEAIALASIKDSDIIKFFWENIITRFGVQGHLYQTTKLSSIAGELGSSAQNRESNGGIRARATRSATAKQKQQIRS